MSCWHAVLLQADTCCCCILVCIAAEHKHRSCHLQPDAVLGIAQLHNLQSLKIDNGAWMDASALRLLLREAVQGERLHIRIVHHRDFADYSIAVSSLQDGTWSE
jgi:hypothetical protein